MNAFFVLFLVVVSTPSSMFRMKNTHKKCDGHARNPWCENVRNSQFFVTFLGIGKCRSLLESPGGRLSSQLRNLYILPRTQLTSILSG